MEKKTILITGGAGFFGTILKKELLSKGYRCVSIDLEEDHFSHPNFTSYRGDIRNKAELKKIASTFKFDAIFHVAAMLAHAVKDKQFLWESNVDGTRNVAEIAKEFDIERVVFTSSNCLWGESFDRPVLEDDAPNPVEIYGRSKFEGEKILNEYNDTFRAIVFRCPTIIDAGRLGLLAILFEFIDENRRVWVVGGGKNRYQFIYAQDLVDAFIRSLNYDKSAIFNIGSDDVPMFREAYEYVIRKTGSKARVANFPRSIAIPAMQVAYFLKMSPLGPYQYKMIAESFVFDTAKIKKELKWNPTLSNNEMLEKAYSYYHENKSEIKNRKGVSAHNQAAKMGVIRLLKWIS